jgi:hypothetical protein
MAMLKYNILRGYGGGGGGEAYYVLQMFYVLCKNFILTSSPLTIYRGAEIKRSWLDLSLPLTSCTT